jgi:hypothetical protein
VTNGDRDDGLGPRVVLEPEANGPRQIDAAVIEGLRAEAGRLRARLRVGRDDAHGKVGLLARGDHPGEQLKRDLGPLGARQHPSEPRLRVVEPFQRDHGDRR